LISYVVDIKICEILDVIYDTNHILYKYEGEINFNKTSNETKQLSDIMDKVIDILTFIKTTSKKIFTKVDPQQFYGNLRKYVRGYSYYNGVRLGSSIDCSTYNYPGGSAGQNPFLFIIKSLFAIEIPEYLKTYHISLIEGFRKPHRDFIEVIKDISLFYKLESYEYTADKYKKCKSLLNDFYIIHKAYIRKYIEEPASLNGVDITQIKGSGDSELDWLKNLHIHYKLSNEN
jgi:hypothetical protein